MGKYQKLKASLVMLEKNKQQQTNKHLYVMLLADLEHFAQTVFTHS